MAAAGALMAASSAWAVPTLTPASGPSGTRVRVSDPACPNRETVGLLRFWAERNAEGEVVSGESPEGGRLVVDGPGTGVLTGPPGTYFLQAQCSAGPGLLPTGIGTRLAFVLGDGGSASAGEPAPAGGPAPSSGEGGGEPPAGGADGVAASLDVEPPAETTRASVRAAEVAARNEERQAGISSRQEARDQEVADRAAARASELEQRQAGIEARRMARAQALAERAEERSAR